jgi:hypothetical protein
MPVDPCLVAVPDHVDLSFPSFDVADPHMYIPDPAWALAAANASRWSVQVQDLDLAKLDPSWFLVFGLEATGYGCTDGLIAADAAHPTISYPSYGWTQAGGCLGISHPGEWEEICRMYDQIDCDVLTHADLIGTIGASEDRVVAGMAALPFLQVFQYAFLTEHDVSDPDAWFDKATDPMALEKMLRLAHLLGAWSDELRVALRDCQDRAIEECLSPGDVRDRLVWTQIHLEDLRAAVGAGACYDGAVSEADARRWAEQTLALFPILDAGAGADAVAQVWREAPLKNFQAIAPTLMDALDASIETPLACPDVRLDFWYDAGCP